MSRYPHRPLAEKRKRVQIQNCIEDKFLRQKLDSISREKLHIDRELRRISLAKESLLESLDRFNSIPASTHKRLSLPCLLDGRKKDYDTAPVNDRRPSIPYLKTVNATPKGRGQVRQQSCDESAVQSIEVKYGPQRHFHPNINRLQRSQVFSEFRVASPITASLILSGKVDKGKATNKRTAFSWQANMDKEKTGQSVRLPEVSDIPTRRELNPQRKAAAGQYYSRDSMLATNLKSKFRQIGSIVMATAILRNADEKKKSKNT